MIAKIKVSLFTITRVKIIHITMLVTHKTMHVLALLLHFGCWEFLDDCMSLSTSRFAEAMAPGGIKLERDPLGLGRVPVFLLK